MCCGHGSGVRLLLVLLCVLVPVVGQQAVVVDAVLMLMLVMEILAVVLEMLVVLVLAMVMVVALSVCVYL